MRYEPCLWYMKLAVCETVEPYNVYKKVKELDLALIIFLVIG